jgi:eukaryotic-like serine/threonine-protein kinase
MSCDPSSKAPDGQELSRWLAAYDDALASGAVPPPPGAGAGAAAPGLGEDLELLHLLDRLRPHQRPREADAGAAAPEEEARYVLCGLRAVGGVGEIWLARDTALGRDVALKVLRPERGADSAFEARFLHEARVTARLQHPGIVPVYDLVPRAPGPPGGAEQPAFYTMRLVPGRDLAAAAQAFHARRAAGAAGALELNALLTAFVSVCQTVAYAHSRGVIHRDLKPSNVALGDFGEVIVLDWGLAREIDQETRRRGDQETSGEEGGPASVSLSPGLPVSLSEGCQTVAGDVLGTPAYMAPEQADGQAAGAGPAADVYGLGAILYEVLTGRPPYQGDDTADVLRQVRAAGPPPPRSVRPDAPLALEAVCLKAMARRPEGRYASAAEVAREVQHWLADEPVAAYPEPAPARLRRWGRRHRPLVAGAAALLLTAALAGGAALVLVRQEQAHTAEARAQATLFKLDVKARSERELGQQLYFHRVALAERTLAANNPSRAFQLLAECPPEFRAWEWHCLKRLCHAGAATLRGHGTVAAVAFSPDGRWLAAASFDGTARVWGADTDRPALTLSGHRGVVYHLAFSPDGRRLATASWDRTARLWDVETGQMVRELRGHTGAVNRVAFRPDGRRLATLGSDHTLRLWDAESGQPVRVLPADVGSQWRVNHVVYSPDGRLFALAGPDKLIRLWDAETGREVRRLEGHRAPTQVVTFSRDGRLLASADGEVGRSDAGEVRLWDAASGEPRGVFRGHTDAVYAVAFSPDGSRLVSASADQTVKLWDLAAGQEALTLHGHTDVVRCAAFSPDGLRLATAGADQGVKLWDATPWSGAGPTREMRTLPGPGGRLFGLAVRPDSRRWAAVGEYTLRVWEDEAEVRTHPLPRVDFFAAAFRPPHPTLSPAGGEGRVRGGGGELATAGSDGLVRLLDATTGRLLRSFPGHAGGPIKGLAFSPDGRLLASAGWDRTVRVWDVNGGAPRHVLRGHTEPVLAVTASPDGRWFASAGADRQIKVWDAATGKEEQTLAGHAGGVLAVRFSPRGDLLASAGNDRTVRLWRVSGWRERPALRGHTAAVRDLAFSPDGQLLVSGGDDWTVRVWRPGTGEELATLRGHTGRVSGVAFAPGRPAVISASFDGTVKVWEVTNPPH